MKPRITLNTFRRVVGRDRAAVRWPDGDETSLAIRHVTVVKLDRLAALAAAITVMDAMADGATADAGFDAGEFSGPAHDRMLDARLDKIARQHGLTRQMLDDLLNGR